MNTKELYQQMYRHTRIMWNQDCAIDDEGICDAIEHLMDSLNYWQNRYNDSLTDTYLKEWEGREAEIKFRAVESFFAREYPGD